MTNSVLTYLDSYCERAGDAALWGEPLNAITNLFFILAAVLAARALLRNQAQTVGLGASLPLAGRAREGGVNLGIALSEAPPSNLPTQGGKAFPASPLGHKIDLWLLIASLFAIGIGSGAWHVHPTGATLLMDVIPITLFMNIYLISALRRLVGLSWRRTLCAWGLYIMLTFAGQAYLPPDLLHGTVMYLPTYVAMVALTFAIARRDHALGKQFAIITTVWSASLIFRTIDLEICSQFPIGTHFLWHTLNAWVLWRLLMLMIGRKR